MRILEHRRGADYSVAPHGLREPREQRLRAYEQCGTLYQLRRMDDVLYRVILRSVLLTECKVILHVPYIEDVVLVLEHVQSLKVPAASVSGNCRENNIRTLPQRTALWNINPRLHGLRKVFVVSIGYAESEIRLPVLLAYLLPPYFLVHPPGAVVVVLFCELPCSGDIRFLQLRDIRIDVCYLVSPPYFVYIGLELQKGLYELELPFTKRLVLSAVDAGLLSCLLELLLCETALGNDVSAFAS